MSVLITLAETFVAVVACGAGQNDCVRATFFCSLVEAAELDFIPPGPATA
jgi:hypothetical protein